MARIVHSRRKAGKEVMNVNQVGTKVANGLLNKPVGPSRVHATNSRFNLLYWVHDSIVILLQQMHIVALVPEERNFLARRHIFSARLAIAVVKDKNLHSSIAPIRRGGGN